MSVKSVVLWVISTILTVAFSVATGVIIYRYATIYNPDTNQVVTISDTHKYLEANWVPELKFGDPFYVPVGIFVNSIHFISPYNVHISGYMWQKYDKKSMVIENKRIEFPEAIDLELEENYRRVSKNDVLTIGWHFEGQFMQNFDYFRFPIDKQVARIRMWHSEDDKNTMLVPDFQSYDVSATGQGTMTGMDPHVVVSGYTVLEAYFSYKQSVYNTDFGIIGNEALKTNPELYFNVALNRNVINSAIVYFLPLATALILMFLGMLLITTRDEHLSFLGYSLINLLSLAAFLLFIVVLSHIQLRTQVTSESIIYLEYIYIIVYLAIVYSVAVAFLIDHASQFNFKSICADDGFWAKVTFLPLVTLACLITTYYSFYDGV